MAPTAAGCKRLLDSRWPVPHVDEWRLVATDLESKAFVEALGPRVRTNDRKGERRALAGGPLHQALNSAGSNVLPLHGGQQLQFDEMNRPRPRLNPEAIRPTKDVDLLGFGDTSAKA
jgi:hypothetical protein